MTIEIKLTKGQVTLIDDEDADLAGFKWCVSQGSRGGGYYAIRALPKMPDGKQVLVRLHRIILGRIIGRPLTTIELADHANGNTLDNRRRNLRVATYSQNGQNRAQSPRTKSGYKGVSFHTSTGKWRARIQVMRTVTLLGYFDTPEEAHAVYCKAAEELHGEFANTGTPVIMESK